MIKNTLVKTMALAIMLFSLNSSANLVTANGLAAGALNLDGGATSFVDFYDLTSSMPNTGFEVANEVIMFVAELDNQYALFTTISGPGSTRGKLNAEFIYGNGSFLLFDEPFELLGTSASWKTGIGKGDGFIFGADGNFLDISIDLSYVLDISKYTFLTFDDAGNASILFSGTIPSGEIIVSAVSTPKIVSVSVPNINAILGFGLLGFAAIRKAII
jgi:hypothetical protein